MVGRIGTVGGVLNHAVRSTINGDVSTTAKIDCSRKSGGLQDRSVLKEHADRVSGRTAALRLKQRSPDTHGEVSAKMDNCPWSDLRRS